MVNTYKKVRDRMETIEIKEEKTQNRMELLDQADIKNFEQHTQMMDTMKNIDCKLEPIAETYRTASRMMKWVMALLIFLSVLGGVFYTWGKIFHK